MALRFFLLFTPLSCINASIHVIKLKEEESQGGLYAT